MSDSTRAQLDFRAGLWNPSRRKYLTEELPPAIELAEEYLSHSLGFESSATRVLPYLGRRKELARGGSVSASTFDLYFCNSELRYRKLGHIFGEITAVSAHEMAHCTRELYFPEDFSLLEIIASEGIANVVQAYIEQDVFDILYENTILADEIDGPSVLHNLFDDPLCYIDVPSETPKNQSPHEWLYEKDCKNYSWGARIGVWCVKSYIDEHGYDFPMLLRLPAEEILAL